MLTGYSRQTQYRSLLVAPQGIRAGLIERIEREIGFARSGRPAKIRFKTNHLVDEQTIDALYRASQAGVEVELLVRTFCTIRAGVPGLSENIRARSILGRFLEHSRIYYFGGDGTPEFWIGSADLMHRNLDRRVEVLCQVSDRQAKAHLYDCLDLAFDEETSAWDLQKRRGMGTLRPCFHRLPGAAHEAAGRPRRVGRAASGSGVGDPGGRRCRVAGAREPGRGRPRPPVPL